MNSALYLSERDKKDGGEVCVSPVENSKSPSEVEDLATFKSWSDAEEFARKKLSENPNGGMLIKNDKKTGKLTAEKI